MCATRYRALLVGNGRFERDPQNLLALAGPTADVAALARALAHDQFGIHPLENITTLVDATCGEIREQADDFFQGASPDDQLLLYYSGHGRKDIRNNLYLCARDTRVDRLSSSGVSDRDINEMLHTSPARRFIIILDCCYSGNFKGGIESSALAPVDGSGRFLLTSCRCDELSADTVEIGGLSAFTHFLVDALASGEVDENADGFVTVNEVYNYVRPRLAAATRQSPQRGLDRTIGDLPLGRSTHRAAQAASGSPETPTPSADSADRPILRVSDERIEFREVRPGEHLPVEVVDVFNDGGGTLDWEATTDEDWIELEPGNGLLKVTLRPKGPGAHRGAIRVRDRGRGGSQKIRVYVDVLANAAPILAVSDRELDFGTLRAGDKRPSRIIHLENRGGGDLAPTATTDNAALALTVTPTAITVRPDISKPVSLAGRIVIESAGGSAAIDVRGDVESGLVIEVDTDAVDFGEVAAGERPTRRIAIGTRGSGRLTWSVEVEGDFFSAARAKGRRGVEITLNRGLKPNRYAGAVVVRSNGGDRRFQVRAHVKAAPKKEPPPLPTAITSDEASPPQPVSGGFDWGSLLGKVAAALVTPNAGERATPSPSNPATPATSSTYTTPDLGGWWGYSGGRIQFSGAGGYFTYLEYNMLGLQVGQGEAWQQGAQVRFRGVNAMSGPIQGELYLQGTTLQGHVMAAGMVQPIILARL